MFMDTINQNKYKAELIFSMIIFGSVGIFVHYINMPSGVIAAARGFLGFLALLVYALLSKSKISWESIKRNLFLLFVSGAFIGFNWIFLFEAYRYTSVAVATLCYYMAPVFLVIISAVVLKEKLSVKKVICVLVSLGGMVLVSGVLETGSLSAGDARGVFYGLISAVLYATVVLINKTIKDVDQYKKTLIQLIFATLVMIPYILIFESAPAGLAAPRTILLLFIIGIVHTGISYVMYFGSFDGLRTQTVAILSYIDPVTSLLLSALILGERLTPFGILGAVLIIGSAIISELFGNRTLK